MNRRAGAWLRLAVGLGALAFLVMRLDLATVVRTLKGADPAWIAAAAAAQIVAKACWVRRWGVLLDQTGHSRSGLELLRLVLLGLFFNNFLPTSVGGDVARAIGLGRGGVPRALAAATVLADRLVGLFALSLIAILGGILGALFWPGDGPWIAATLFAGGVAVALGIGTHPRVLDRMTRSRGFSFGGRVVRKLKRVLDQLSFLAGRTGTLGRALALSLGLAVCSAAYHWSVGRALGINLPFAAWLVIVPTVMLFAALPITLNGLGVRELGFVGLLGAQGVEASAATVFALLAFAGTLGFAIAGGILFLTGRRGERQLEGGTT